MIIDFLFCGKMITILTLVIFIMKSKSKSEERWHFTTQHNAKGLLYLYAYQTKWNPLKKRSERSAKKYAGRIKPDGTIAFSSAFIEQFPQYAKGTFIFDNVVKFPQAIDIPQCEEEKLEDGECAGDDANIETKESQTIEGDPNTTTRSVGLAWALFETAKSMGVLADLKATFGDEDGYALFLLAVYRLHGGLAMMGFEEWQETVYLKRYLSLSGQRISELLSRVTNESFSRYFARRHERKALEYGPGKLLHYACDSTNISTYSKTIESTAFGHAKRDPELPIVNYAIITDQLSGDIVFAHEYQGSINDVTSLQTILARMIDAGMDLDKIVLLTDRGYSSISNVCKMLNVDLKFVQGVRISEDSVKNLFRKHETSLNDISFYNNEIGFCAYPEQELFDGTHLNLHLYRAHGQQQVSEKELMHEVLGIQAKLNAGERVFPDEWDTYGKYLIKRKGNHREDVWVVDIEKIKATTEFSGAMALRTNVTRNPILAMKMYRTRSLIELDFNQFKNWVGGDRFRCTSTSYLGILLVTTIATSIRMVMLNKVNQSEQKGLKKPDDSLNSIFLTLKKLKADKQLSGNAWVRRDLPKKYKDMFDLIQVNLPPRILK